MNFIDTALAYGEGRSERLVGGVVRKRPDTIHVATKVPPKNLTWPAPDDTRDSLRLIESGAADTVQVIYNVFDQSPEDELFGACREHEVGVIARVPLDEGGLTGTVQPDSRFAEDDHRSDYFRGDRPREVHERVARIVSDLGIAETEVAETALRYVLSEPTVSTVIPGMRSKRNVERNVAASDGQGLDERRREKLHAHRWLRNFYR